VEVVIVILIIGILAAIALPRLWAAAQGTGEAALVSNLSTLRRAIESYAAEHDQAFPGAAADGQGGGPGSAEAFVSQLTMFSAADGSVSATADPTHPFGPYIGNVPKLPVGANKGSDAVAIDATNSPPLVTAGNEGWVYNPQTGRIIANSDDASGDGLRAYDEF